MPTAEPTAAVEHRWSAKTLRQPALVVVRVLLAVFGGYAFTAVWSAAFALILTTGFGSARAEAVVLSAMLGFLVYLGVLLWAHVERRLIRVALVLGLGGGIGYAVMRWLSVIKGATDL
jgi:hypothetical protein